MLTADGTPILPSITAEDFSSIKNHLFRLNDSLATNLCLLGNLNGLLILAAGDIAPLKATSLASLLAANISAAQQIAPLAGEPNGFEKNFFEGHQSSLYVHEISRDYILAVSFSGNTTFGMVRTTVERYSTIFEELLEQKTDTALNATESLPVTDKEFSDELSTKLTSLFKLED